MRIIIKRIFDLNKNETGSILTASVNHPTTAPEKSLIENILKDYVYNSHYPGEAVTIYSEVRDVPSIVVIRKIDDLSAEEINIK